MKQEINIKVAQEIPDHNYALFGQEVNGSTWALARMNMFLHGEDGGAIRLARKPVLNTGV